MKSKILLVPDVSGWVLDFNIDSIMELLGNKYLFQKKYRSELKKEDITNSDIVYLSYWRLYRSVHVEIEGKKFCTTVTSHSFEEQPDFAREVWNRFHSVTVPSLILLEILKGKHPHVFYTPRGVDERFFYPKRKRKSKRFKLGWAGNPDHGQGKVKGFHDLLLPVVKKMPNVELKTALQGKNQLSHEEMMSFYNSLDAYICTSKWEGEPYTCLEAAACGVPIITTHVGIMPQLINEGENGFFIKRTKEGVRKGIEKMMESDFRGMGEKAREEIEKNWTWQKNIAYWENFFDFMVRENMDYKSQ